MPGNPASSIARMLWQAETPEPQLCTTVSCDAPSSSAVNSARRNDGCLNVPSASRFSGNGRLCAPGMWPATGPKGSTSPRKRSGERASIRNSVWRWMLARTPDGVDGRRHAPDAEIRRSRLRHVGVHRAALLHPLGEAAVENGDGVVPQPAQHPPQPAPRTCRWPGRTRRPVSSRRCQGARRAPRPLRAWAADGDRCGRSWARTIRARHGRTARRARAPSRTRPRPRCPAARGRGGRRR